MKKIRFSLGLAPGSQPMDLTKFSILYSNETVAPQHLLPISGTSGAVYGCSATKAGCAVTTMSAQDQIEIEFLIGTYSANMPGKNVKFTIEIRSPVGSALSFSKTIPAYLNPVNGL